MSPPSVFVQLADAEALRQVLVHVKGVDLEYSARRIWVFSAPKFPIAHRRAMLVDASGLWQLHLVDGAARAEWILNGLEAEDMEHGQVAPLAWARERFDLTAEQQAVVAAFGPEDLRLAGRYAEERTRLLHRDDQGQELAVDLVLFTLDDDRQLARLAVDLDANAGEDTTTARRKLQDLAVGAGAGVVADLDLWSTLRPPEAAPAQAT